MSLFRKRNPPEKPKNQQLLYSAPRHCKSHDFHCNDNSYEIRLYRSLRQAVPILDAAIQKIVRLTGSFELKCSDKTFQKRLDYFAKNIPVGHTMSSLQSFADVYLDSMITYGNGLGEMCIDPKTKSLSALICAEPSEIIVRAGKVPGSCQFFYPKNESNDELIPLPHPERILFTALSPAAGEIYGTSLLRGLPSLSDILLRIYECIGQNYERSGNVRYAVIYKPGNDPSDRAYAGERAAAIAREWSDGMAAASNGEVRDFICAGDVEIKVIGAENQLMSTEVPVRQLLEQIIAKLSIPPFLLGLNWSSTERMSSQQADILTSELEYYRRLLTPVLTKIGKVFIGLQGSDAEIEVLWSNISLQDETELADARLKNAQALEIENRIEEGSSDNNQN